MVVDKSDDLGMHYIGVHQLLIGKLRIHISERAIVVPVFRCLLRVLFGIRNLFPDVGHNFRNFFNFSPP